ncbi:MAG TPA: DUF4012 domain-containing protein [Candidatus Bipolaricaulota bacterium]|nr:DUF4012 domain-containing protein [Candidatus Bipolaricaulota bacterium]
MLEHFKNYADDNPKQDIETEKLETRTVHLKMPEPKVSKTPGRIGKFFVAVFRVLPTALIVSLAGVIIALVAIGLLFLPYLSVIKAVYLDTHAAVENLKLAQNYLLNQKFNEAEQPLNEAKSRFSSARQEIEPMLTSFYTKIGYVNQQFLGVNDLLIIGEQISDSLIDINKLGEKFIDVTGATDVSLQNLSSEKKREILMTLVNAGPELEKISDNLAQSTQKLNEFQSRPLFPLLVKAAQPISDNLPLLDSLAQKAIVYGQVLPPLLGYPDQANYLLLLENNDELRPGGGFIGTYGIVKVKDAELISVFTDNIYNLDYPSKEYLKIKPPAPIGLFLSQEFWFMRDSNWWHDFPTSAEKVEWFYHLENGTEKNINGVIGMTQTFIEDLLSLVGPIEVGEFTFTADNFTDQLQYQVEKGYLHQGISTEGRKDIIGDLAKELQHRLFTLPQNQWSRLYGIISENFKEKHLMIYSKNKSLQTRMTDLGWTAEVNRSDGDYLAVVDANLAALKTDLVMSRNLEYEVKETENGLTAKLKMVYANSGEFSWKTTRYRTYNRVYVPKGSQLISYRENGNLVESKDVDIFEELGKQVFGHFFIVEPKETRTLEITYKLPATIGNQINSGVYNLVVQKQPGLDLAGLKLDLNFSKSAMSYSEGMVASGNDLQFSGNLLTDKMFNISFK